MYAGVSDEWALHKPKIKSQEANTSPMLIWSTGNAAREKRHSLALSLTVTVIFMVLDSTYRFQTS